MRDSQRDMLPWVLCLLLAFSVRPAHAQRPVDGMRAALSRADSVIAGEIDRGFVPGAVLLVSLNGDVVFEKAYGHARLYEFDRSRTDTPELLTVDHLFDLASLSKVFGTTMAVMLLADRGVLDLDVPLYRYLPDFRGENKDSVTVRHLLSHTAGLEPWKPIYYHADQSGRALAYVTSLPLAYSVATARHYSDLGFMLLGAVVERLTGESLDSFLERSLYGPLQLETVTFRPLEKGHTLIAATSHGNPYERRMIEDDNFGYKTDEDPASFTGWRNYVLQGEVNDGNAFHAFEGVAGHAGLFGTAKDLSVLLQVLLNKGRYGGSVIFRPETVNLFLKPDHTGSGLGWAMAPDIIGVEYPGAFGHSGFTGTHVVAIPELDLSIILLTNRQHGGPLPSGYYPNTSGLFSRIADMIVNGALKQSAE